MLKFKQFINESVDDTIDTDSRRLSENMEAFNDELDNLTLKPYQNAPVFLAQLRGVCERYGIQIPQSATPEFMNLGAELVYSLGTSGFHLYIVYDTHEEDGFVDGYAQVVSSDELQDLMGMSVEDLAGEREAMLIPPNTYGNSDEY
jgi:hypothetical protein